MVIIQEIVKSKHFYKVYVILSILQMLNYFILITTLWCILLWCILLLSLFLYKWGNWDPGRLNDLTNVTQLVSAEEKKIVQSCPTLWNPMDCSLPGSSIHGILQTRILEWVAMPSSKGSSQPRTLTQVSCIAGRFFTPELPGKANKWQSQDSNPESGSKVIAGDPLHSELDLLISSLSVWNTITPLPVGPSLLDLS